VTVSFLFRKPKFPIICDIDGYVIAANSISDFEKQLSAYNICKGTQYPIIDITGEGWSFYPEHMAISPLTTKKKWFKKDVIAIFNNRIAFDIPVIPHGRTHFMAKVRLIS
jgi:hypothetical protein